MEKTTVRIGLNLDKELHSEMKSLIPPGEKSKIIRHLLWDFIRLLRAAKEENCIQLTIGALLNNNIKLTVTKNETAISQPNSL